eukprot:gene15859-18845_t
MTGNPSGTFSATTTDDGVTITSVAISSISGQTWIVKFSFTSIFNGGENKGITILLDGKSLTTFSVIDLCRNMPTTITPSNFYYNRLTAKAVAFFTVSGNKVDPIDLWEGVFRVNLAPQVKSLQNGYTSPFKLTITNSNNVKVFDQNVNPFLNGIDMTSVNITSQSNFYPQSSATLTKPTNLVSEITVDGLIQDYSTIGSGAYSSLSSFAPYTPYTLPLIGNPGHAIFYGKNPLTNDATYGLYNTNFNSTGYFQANQINSRVLSLANDNLYVVNKVGNVKDHSYTLRFPKISTSPRPSLPFGVSSGTYKSASYSTVDFFSPYTLQSLNSTWAYGPITKDVPVVNPQSTGDINASDDLSGISSIVVGDNNKLPRLVSIYDLASNVRQYIPNFDVIDVNLNTIPSLPSNLQWDQDSIITFKFNNSLTDTSNGEAKNELYFTIESGDITLRPKMTIYFRNDDYQRPSLTFEGSWDYVNLRFVIPFTIPGRVFTSSVEYTIWSNNIPITWQMLHSNGYVNYTTDMDIVPRVAPITVVTTSTLQVTIGPFNDTTYPLMFDPLVKVLEDSVNGILTQTYPCAATPETVSPSLVSMTSSSSTIDVRNAPRTVSVTITVQDANSGVSTTRSPVVYVSSYLGNTIGFESVEVSRSLLTATFTATLDIPFGFGTGTPYLFLSVYGIMDNHYNLVGYSYSDLLALNQLSNLTITESTTFYPIIEKASDLSIFGGDLTITGRSFGITPVSVKAIQYRQDGESYTVSPTFASAILCINTTRPDGNGTDPTTNPSTDDVSSLISIYSIRELSVQGEILIEYIVKNWTYVDKSTEKQNHFIYSTVLENTNTQVNVTIQFFMEDTNVEFAGDVMLMKASSTKFSMSLGAYTFSHTLNTLQVVMEAALSSKDDKDCKASDKEMGLVGDNLQWIKLKVKDKMLYGTFTPKGVVDGRIVIPTTKVLDDSVAQGNLSRSLIGTSVPFYRQQVLLDPNWSILIDPTIVDGNCGSSKSVKLDTVKIIGVALGVAGFLAVVIISIVYVVHKNRQAELNRIEMDRRSITMSQRD